MIDDCIKFLCFLFLCMTNNYGFVSGEVRCMATEREALLKFQRGLIDDHGLLSSWGSEDYKMECCNWIGVSCSNTTGHVIGLQLGGTYLSYSEEGCLSGKIDPSILELHHLISLDLSSNNFSGERIPEFIGSMTNLQYLDFGQSGFFGIVPHQLWNLTNLKELSLWGNSLLRFENVNGLSHLSLLTGLHLSKVKINDPNWLQQILLLPFLKNLMLSDCSLPPPGPFLNNSSSHLAFLDLSSNGLTPSTFDWLFNISSKLVYVDLSYNHLNGLIPDAFGNLIFLKELLLDSNMFKGGIPKSFGNSSLVSLTLRGNNLGQPLAKLFGSLCCKANTLLTIIDFSDNAITGLVPDMMSSFLSLEYLGLSGNNFTGSLPLSLGQLTTLTEIDVSNSSLEGTITEAHFIKLHNLDRLDLSCNKAVKLQISPGWNPPFQLSSLSLTFCEVGPHFPSWLQHQRTLDVLDLSHTNISDEVPHWMWSLSPSVYYFNISHNQIHGTIPKLSSLIEVIDISSNNFSGPVPLFHPNTSIVQISNNKFEGSISSICSNDVYCSLVMIDASNNQLQGLLPNCWHKMESLRILNLANNFFSGEIPDSLGSLWLLKTLHLQDNYLSGELPATLRNCRSLQLIDIQDNKLSGNIPRWIGANYTFMVYLSFGRNSFSGSIPPEICNLTKLQVLDVSRNNISGKIPRCFDHFTTLVQMNGTSTDEIQISPVGLLDYPWLDKYPWLFNFHDTGFYKDSAQVRWKTQELEYQNLRYLGLIDLSNNRIDGSIPKELFSLRGLVSLNLSRNCLTGIIDPDIGQMEKLEALDISRNQLDGVIPAGMARLHFLAVLDLSYNNLSGKIPTSTQLQSFDASFYSGNALLCGPPLAPCPGDAIDSTPKKQGSQRDHGETEDGFMNLSFVQDLGMSMAFGFIFGFWGFVGPLLLMRTWRVVYFRFFDHIGNWLYVKTSLFLAKFKQTRTRG